MAAAPLTIIAPGKKAQQMNIEPALNQINLMTHNMERTILLYGIVSNFNGCALQNGE